MGSIFDKFQDATVEDILQDPNKFGAPTLEQFKQNREKYLGRADHWFQAVDKGSSALSRRVKKHIYKLKGYRVESLEKLEQIAESMGLDPFKLVPRPQVEDVGGGWCNLIVTFVDPVEEKAKEDQLRAGDNGENQSSSQ